MNRHKEHWKQKKRRHDRWIQNAKEANKVLDVPNTLDKVPTTLFSNPRQFRHANVKMTAIACYSIKLTKPEMVTVSTLSACFAYKKVNSKSLGIL